MATAAVRWGKQTTDEITRVAQEMRRFEEKLPELKENYSGRWVVFKDGKVHSDHATENDIYAAGIALFGLDGGHVVAILKDIGPVPVSASVLYGMQFA